MKHPVILEYSPATVEILAEKIVDEKSGDKELDVKVLWQKAGVVNNNGRRYRKELLQREIKKISERIKNGETVWGSHMHPEDGVGETEDISHKWNSVGMNKDGICEGELTILPTASGKNIQVLVKSGRLGLSSRGFGTMTKKEEPVNGEKIKFDDINDDFELASPGDWVVRPSVRGAGNIKVSESIRILESELNKEFSSATLNKKEEELMELKELEDKIAKLEKDLKDRDAEIEKLKTEFKDKLEKAVEAAYDEGHKDGIGEDKDEKIASLKAELEKQKTDFEDEKKKVEDEKKKDEEKIKELEQKEKDRLAAEEKAKAEVEKQKALKAKVEEILGKDEYKVYKPLIEKEITSEDGKINIEEVEKVEETVKGLFDKFSGIVAEAEKAKIVSSGIGEVGHIPSPEGEEVDQEETARRLYDEAVRKAGYKKSFADFKKEVLAEK